MTLDGQRIDVDTGQLLRNQKHLFTASSKQSLHLGIMAKALNGQHLAQLIYTPDEVINLVRKKVNTLTKFFNKYPGFGGFMPWVNLTDPLNMQPTWDFRTSTPALDNGQMFWASYALSSVWRKKYPNKQFLLLAQFQNITWKYMLKNAKTIFFNSTTGKIRAVSQIKNISLAPQLNQYTNKDDYYLDDPYQGELFIQIFSIFGGQLTPQQIQSIWFDKRKKLVPVFYQIASQNISLKVQRGYWFSAHQQWKNLFLPYLLSPTYAKVFQNNQKVRTWNSYLKNIPGLYAATTGMAKSNSQNLDYFADCGIPQISTVSVKTLDQITPYGSFPLFMINQSVAAVWYHHMLLQPAGQNNYGSTEATAVNGSLVSPMLTWDTKITTLLAIMGGTLQIISQQLLSKNYLVNFFRKVQQEYSRAFSPIQKSNIQYALPKFKPNNKRIDFTTCAGKFFQQK